MIKAIGFNLQKGRCSSLVLVPSRLFNSFGNVEELKNDRTRLLRQLEDVNKRIELLSTSSARSSANVQAEEEKPPSQRPLSGVRVLDLSRILAGPTCGQILADLGAEVIKVERPGVGDDTRSWGPPFVGEGDHQTATYYLACNRGKKSVAIDLQKKESADLIGRLADNSDVVIENFIPGTTTRLGIDSSTLRGRNPRLIYASITGFGESGPYRDRPGYDVNISAMGGMMSITGERNGPPVKVGVALTDILTGILAATGIVSCLHQRETSGIGAKLEYSLLDTQVWSLANVATAFLNGDYIGERWGTAHASIVPYQAFQASDGYIVVSANNDEQWIRLCIALARSDLADDSRYVTNRGRVEHREALIPELQATFKLKSRADWISTLSKHRIAVCPINDVREVFEDPHVLYRKMKVAVPHRSLGEVILTGIPWIIDGCRPGILSSPPDLGQHTDDVLCQVLGLSEKEIRELKHHQVVA